MPRKENTALRLHRILTSMVDQPPNVQTQWALLRGLHIEPTKLSPRLQATNAARFMLLLHGEFEELLTQFRQHGYTPASYSSLVNAFENGLTIKAMSSAWEQGRPAFSACLAPLLVFGESLPDEEEIISEQALTDLAKEISDLRDSVNDSALPGFVKEFILQQLTIISRAVEEYPVIGAKAFRAAVREGVFYEAQNYNEEIEKNDTAPQLTKLKELQQKVIAMSKFTGELSKFLLAGDVVAHHARSAVEAGRHLGGWAQHLLK